MDYTKIEKAINAVLEEHDAFLVDIEVDEGNVIGVFVDSDSGIQINQLKYISRGIETELDREEEDFALTVSSPGLDRPLKLKRQYKNNIGRWVKVKTNQEKTVKGELTAVNDELITVTTPAKKKKEEATVTEIPFAEIVETKIQVRF